MINQCKHNIADYAFEVKDFKKNVNDCNTNFRGAGTGYGVSDRVFEDMDD